MVRLRPAVVTVLFPQLCPAAGRGGEVQTREAGGGEQVGREGVKEAAGGEDAPRNRSIMEAEAEAEATALKGDAEAYAIEIKAKVGN